MNHTGRLVIVHLTALYALLGAALFFMPFSLFGQDGYIGWGPIIAEYLRGDARFTHSPVTFGGQNLLAIYGFLPFWKLFRQLGFNFIQAENYSLWVCWLLLQYYTFSFYRLFRREVGLIDFYLLAFYVLASPILINRIYAGHINLLFTFLSSFVVIQLITSQSKTSLLINTFTLWFALSIQGYQLIAYNLFYLPIFAMIYWHYGIHKKLILRNALIVGSLATVLAFPALMAMVKHALSAENIRGTGVNMVYSYTQLDFLDLLNLIFVSIENPFTGHKHFGFFHEITYPMGIFFFIFLILELPRSLKISCCAVLLLTILFSANVPPFSWMSQLPVISSFRVPQRALMLPTFLIPLFVLARTRWTLSPADFLLPALGLAIIFIHPLHETILFFILGFLLLYQMVKHRPHLQTTIVLTALLSLGLSSLDKLPIITDSYASFKHSQRLIQRAIKRFGPTPPMSQFVFHLDGLNKVQLNATAKIYNIKTLEGYGHPPKSLLLKLEELTGQSFSVGQNHLYLDSGHKNFQQTVRSLGIDYILHLEQRP